MAKTKSGAQVFFFPDENQKVLEHLGMSESVYVAQHYERPSLTASEDDFCMLDDVGSGFGQKPSEPKVTFLNKSQSISLIENHFAVTKEKANSPAIDYLKTPKGFPKLFIVGRNYFHFLLFLS